MFAQLTESVRSVAEGKPVMVTCPRTGKKVPFKGSVKKLDPGPEVPSHLRGGRGYAGKQVVSPGGARRRRIKPRDERKESIVRAVLRSIYEGDAGVIYVTDPATGKKVPYAGKVKKLPTRRARGIPKGGPTMRVRGGSAKAEKSARGRRSRESAVERQSRARQAQAKEKARRAKLGIVDSANESFDSFQEKFYWMLEAKGVEKHRRQQRAAVAGAGRIPQSGRREDPLLTKNWARQKEGPSFPGGQHVYRSGVKVRGRWQSRARDTSNPRLPR